MPLLRSLVLLGTLLLALPAAASSRPTSGDPSARSGRTLGVGETLVVASAGWPGAFAEAIFAPSSSFNVGARLGFVWASPLIGFGTGFGTEVSAPMRIHLLSEGSLDLSLAIRSLLVLGQGALVGQEGVFSDDFGWGAGGELGVVAGYQTSDSFTLVFGGGAGVFGVGVPGAEGTGEHLVGSVLFRFGGEFLLDRDVLLFAELTGGYGLAPAATFESKLIARLELGAAFLL